MFPHGVTFRQTPYFGKTARLPEPTATLTTSVPSKCLVKQVGDCELLFDRNFHQSLLNRQRPELAPEVEDEVLQHSDLCLQFAFGFRLHWLKSSLSGTRRVSRLHSPAERNGPVRCLW